MFSAFFKKHVVSTPLILRRRAMGPFNAAGATAGVIIITVYLSAPAFVLQRAIQPTPAVAVTRPAENGGAEVTFDELRWLAREAEIKCDEWIAAKPAGDPEGAQRLAFELSCRCAHRREKVRKVFENFIQANPEHRGAKAEFEQFSRAMTEKIDAVLEFERLRVEDRDDPAGWQLLGTYYNNQGMVARAIECFSKAVALPHRDPQVYEEFAVMLTLFRNDAAAYFNTSTEAVLDRAITLYQKAMHLDPKNYFLARRYAELHYLLRPARNREGLAAWEHTLALAGTESEQQEAIVNCARFALSLGRFALAGIYSNRLVAPELAETKLRIDRCIVLKKQHLVESLRPK